MDYKDFRCTWIHKREIWNIADKTREYLWPSRELPINIEDIIEIKLKLEVEPIIGLLSLTDVDAFLKIDLSGLIIDHDCYMEDKFSNRLRFTLAHELGHYILHKDIYSNLNIISSAEWKNFILNAPETEYKNFEWQANEFAGRFLVPYDDLKVTVATLKDLFIQNEKLRNYLEDAPDAVLSGVSPFLRKPFGVSEEVIERRVEREGLWPPTFFT